MRIKQKGALLLASAMMVGTIGMMNPTQVQAATPATNQYTLTVPAETTLAYDGSAVELTNGLKVSGGDLGDGKKVTVTASSANEWVLKGSKTETTTTIAYGLYATADATDTTTSWDFSKADAAGDGKTVAVYSMITASDYQSADADDYSDTITFTAKVEDAAAAATLNETQVIEMCEAVADKLVDTTWFTSPTNIKNNWGSFASFVEGATFTDNNDGTYTFTKKSRHEGMGDETTVVTITDGKVVSVIRTFDGSNQMKFYYVD